MTGQEIGELLEKQRAFYKSGATVPVAFRREQLKKLYAAVKKYQKEIEDALKADLGKSPYEGFMCESGLVLTEISYMLRHVRKFAKRKRVHTPLAQFLSHSFRQPVPYGNVLIMSPWNYPFLLTLNPLTDAIAAGNTVILKPSAYSPATGRIVEKMIGECFAPEYVAVVRGGRAENQALLDQKLDFVFFTGSQAVGREVLRHTAEHLTPAVLELGGKSPCIVGRDADIPLAARRIVWGKLLNAGQTCVAPDYLFVHADRKRQLCVEMERAVRRFFGDDPRLSDDYPRIVSVQAAERLQRMMHGSGKILFGGTCDPQQRYVAPTLIDEPDDDSPVMRQEIFGPLLPVKGFHDIETVIRYVNERDKPLALYYFGGRREADRVLRSTSSGGACVNDTVVQLANGRLPFGGVGRSGIGKYHGRFSFELFSNLRAVVRSPRWIDIPLRYAPYRSIRLFKKFLK